MRSAKEAGCFPYGSNLICYIEVCKSGEIRQLTNKTEKFHAFLNAMSGASTLYAVWPGNWHSDLFIIDDLNAFSVAQKF